MSKPEPSHVETFKALLTKLLKGYRFDIEGLYRSDGTVLPLPRESSLIGKVVEVTSSPTWTRKSSTPRA